MKKLLILLLLAFCNTAIARIGYTLDREVYQYGPAIYLGTAHEGVDDIDYGVCDVYSFREGRIEVWIIRQDIGLAKAGTVVYESILIP